MVNPRHVLPLQYPRLIVNLKESISMFIPVEQRPETPAINVSPVPAIATPTEALARHPEPAMEPPEVTEELLIEEVSIDGMCGVY